jgi:hypothetical protein
MPPLLIRERVFDAVCLLIGRIGRAFGYKAKPPYIIIGTGRSGTNLMEDILNSHPEITGFPGEANELWHPLLEPFESTQLDIPPIEVDPKKFSEVSVANWPPGHEQRIRDIFAGFQLINGSPRVFFAKSAMISFMMPIIQYVFPDATFIHIYRFGLSVVESYFKKNYGKYSRFIYSEKEYKLYCAKYWNACILEIDQRNKELSLDARRKFYEFSYESLCQKPKEILVNLAEFIGVKPDGFTFDLSQIANQNYKVRDYIQNPEAVELLEVMSPGMKLKGYELDKFLV